MSEDASRPERVRPAAPEHSRAGAADGVPASGRRRHRLTGRYKTVISLVVVLASLVGPDRLAEFVTARKLADRIQSTQHLSSRPT